MHAQRRPRLPRAAGKGSREARSSAEASLMARTIELRRHTDSDGDVLSDEGIRAALEIGTRLRGGYALLVSSGAQRATQTLGCFLAALGEKVEGGVVVEPALRSKVEDRWRDAYRRAGSGGPAAPRGADPPPLPEDPPP